MGDDAGRDTVGRRRLGQGEVIRRVGLFVGLTERRGAGVKVFIAWRIRIVDCIGVAATRIVCFLFSAIVRVEGDLNADVLIVAVTLWRKIRTVSAVFTRRNV